MHLYQCVLGGHALRRVVVPDVTAQARMLDEPTLTMPVSVVGTVRDDPAPKLKTDGE